MDRVRLAYGAVSRFFYYLGNQVTGIGDVPVAPSPGDADGRSEEATGQGGDERIQKDANQHGAPLRA